MKYSTYSFKDVIGVIQHVSVGQYSLTGEGTGEIGITFAGDKTSQEIAVDGGVFVLRIPGNNGTITLNIQQTSPLNHWLAKWYKYISYAKPSEWAKATIYIRNSINGQEYKAIGVSPQNHPDVNFKAQGQTILWVLACADLKEVPVPSTKIATEGGSN